MNFSTISILQSSIKTLIEPSLLPVGFISILQSSIKTKDGFQFLDIRIISILQSSIKTRRRNMEAKVERHFNSTKFD